MQHEKPFPSGLPTLNKLGSTLGGVFVMNKKCCRCKQDFPATKEYFYACNKSKDGLRWECKSCKAKAQHEYRGKYKESVSEKRKQYKEKNKEKIKIQNRKYYLNNKEKIEQYRVDNSEKIKKYHKEYYKQNRDKHLVRCGIYFENNKDSIYAKVKEYRQKNPERLREYYRQYRNEHSDECGRNKQKYLQTEKGKMVSRKHNHKRRARKQKVAATLTPQQWIECQGYFDNKCCYCGSTRNLEQDHFIPLSLGGCYTVDNIVVACRTCNSSKNNRDFFEWYPGQPQYSKHREMKIIKYLKIAKEA